MARCLAFGAMAWLLVLGCSDPEPKAPYDGVAGTSSIAGAGGGGGTAAVEPGEGGASGSGEPMVEACNELELDVPAFSLSNNSKPHNIADGGDIADGTYFISAQVMFESESPLMLEIGRTKVVIEGGVWQEVSGDAEVGGVNPDKRSTYALSFSDTTLELERTCPSVGEPESFEYSADEYGFTLYVNDGGAEFGTVFTRQ